MNNLKDRVIAIISRVLKLDDRERAMLAKETGHEQLRKWTSARHAEIIVALEDEFGIEIDGRDMARLNDVSKIMAYIQSKQS
jgi:acyl carrier protein